MFELDVDFDLQKDGPIKGKQLEELLCLMGKEFVGVINDMQEKIDAQSEQIANLERQVMVLKLVKL